MICEQCKKCFNYLVSELGCLGNDKPCEYLQMDNQYFKETLESIKRSMY